MRSKLAISALVVASLFGSTLVASAQNQPAPGASSEGNVGPGATSMHKTRIHHASTKVKHGTTTGMARSHRGSAAANPSSQSNVGPGTKQ